MPPKDDSIPGVDLTGDEYRIKQAHIRNRYAVYDQNGDLILRAKQKLFRVKEEFPFVDANGNPVFTVKAQNLLDIKGDYALTSAAGGGVFATLRKDFTLFVHRWRVLDASGNELAIIRSRNKVLSIMRSFIGLTNLIPHSYVIETPGGEQIGEIQGHFSLRDIYTLRMTDLDNAPKESLIAAAIAVDALEGN